jgi:hypothetical protein
MMCDKDKDVLFEVGKSYSFYMQHAMFLDFDEDSDIGNWTIIDDVDNADVTFCFVTNEVKGISIFTQKVYKNVF